MCFLLGVGGSESIKVAGIDVSSEERTTQVERLLRVTAALELKKQALGEPTREMSKTAPAHVVATSLAYLQNQRSRMRYPEYRQQGLPITSTYVESTVKQINRRMKGSEKFWSHGVEGMLTLGADHLGDTPTLARYWRNRPDRLVGSRAPQITAV